MSPQNMAKEACSTLRSSQGLELSIWEFEGLLNFTSELGSEGSSLEGCWGSLAVPEFWDRSKADESISIPRVHYLRASHLASQASDTVKPSTL